MNYTTLHYQELCFELIVKHSNNKRSLGYNEDKVDKIQNVLEEKFCRKKQCQQPILFTYGWSEA